jgi:hypothetical protein
MYDLSSAPVSRNYNQFSSIIKPRDKESNSVTLEKDENAKLSSNSVFGTDTLAKGKKAWQATQDLEKQRIIDQLRSIDAEVHAHEMSHIAAAGGAATSGPTYVYVTGPDGKAYAVGGEVSISLSSVPGNLQATIQKARAIRSAALAPGNPSSADLSVAAAASQMEAEALAALNKQMLSRMQSVVPGQESNAAVLQTKSIAEQTYNAVSSKLKEPIIDLYA